MRRLAHVLDEAAAPGRPLDALHLGGGALTLPRYLAAVRPHSRQEVIEADRGLLDLVTEHLPLPGDCGITVHAEDARTALEAAPQDSADVIVADVFGGSRVPAQLTSVEYAQAAARVLRPDGCYAANLADGAPFGFLRGQLANFSTVFEHLALIAEPSVLRGRRFGNAVLLASRAPLPIAALARRTAGDAFPARVEHGAALRRLMRGRGPRTRCRGGGVPGAAGRRVQRRLSAVRRGLAPGRRRPLTPPPRHAIPSPRRHGRPLRPPRAPASYAG